ncbi:MAG: hypothetical protein ACJA0N_002894, partial [Pseudohongiellaceae bacterium]
MKKSNPFTPVKHLLIASVISMTGASGMALASTTPTLDLFPVSVKEQIRQTSEAAKTIETNIQGVISQMDSQHELYQASKCD